MTTCAVQFQAVHIVPEEFIIPQLVKQPGQSIRHHELLKKQAHSVRIRKIKVKICHTAVFSHGNLIYFLSLDHISRIFLVSKHNVRHFPALLHPECRTAGSIAIPYMQYSPAGRRDIIYSMPAIVKPRIPRRSPGLSPDGQCVSCH